jgi:hypothetical protein
MVRPPEDLAVLPSVRTTFRAYNSERILRSGPRRLTFLQNHASLFGGDLPNRIVLSRIGPIVLVRMMVAVDHIFQMMFELLLVHRLPPSLTPKRHPTPCQL